MEFLIFVKMSRFLVPQVECTLFLARRLHENDIVIYGARLHMGHTMSTELASVCFFLFFVFNVCCCYSFRRLLHVESVILCRRSFAPSPPYRHTCISCSWYVYDFVGKGCHSLFSYPHYQSDLSLWWIYLPIETDALYFPSSFFIMV